MMYCDFRFEITEKGLLFQDKPDPDETHMVRIDRTSFTPGDSFTLELDELGRMFFRKQMVQLSLDLG